MHEQEAGSQGAAGCSLAVGFHNFNLRIFNLRVPDPNRLIVDVFVDTMSDFNVPGSRPKKHDEISEIDRARAGWVSARHTWGSHI